MVIMRRHVCEYKKARMKAKSFLIVDANRQVMSMIVMSQAKDLEIMLAADT